MKKVFDIDNIRKQKEELSARLVKMETFLELAEELGIESIDSPSEIIGTKNGTPNKKSIIRSSEWDKKWAFRKKILFALSQLNRFSHVTEIVGVLKSHNEPETIKGSKDNLQARVSAALTALKKLPNIGLEKYAEEGSIRNQYWGFYKWKDGDKIKAEYAYKVQ